MHTTVTRTKIIKINIPKGGFDMGRKSLSVLSIIICLMFLLGSLLISPAQTLAQDPIKLKLSNGYPARHPMAVKGFGGWAKMVEERTNNAVKITLFPGNTLTKIKEAYDATIAGVADIAMTVPGYAPGRFPLSPAVNLPMVFSSSTVASRVTWDLYNKIPAMRAEYSEVKVLFFYCTPPYEIHTVNKSINTSKDLKGQQIRASDPISAKILENLGATPVALSMPEAYMGLQKGVLDGLVSPFGPMRGLKTANVTKYHTVNANLFTNVFAIVMNLKKWNSLSPEIQKVIDEVSGAAASERFGKMFDKLSVPDINYMKKQGDTFITLAPEEKKRWAAAILPIRDKWIKDRTAKGLPADKVVSEMIRLSESFSQ